MKIIVIGQQKGGVGKSTLTANIAVVLAQRGERVIIVDADKQQTCVKWGSRRQLAGTDPQVSFASLLAKERKARDFVEIIHKLGGSEKFDVCLIDVGGRDNRELRASLALAHVLLAPSLPSQADVESLGEFDEVVGEVSTINPALKAYTVINKANTGLNFGQEIELAADAMAEMENLGRPVAVVTERPNFRATWMEGQAVHDLPDTPSSLKAKAEIENIIEAL